MNIYNHEICGKTPSEIAQFALSNAINALENGDFDFRTGGNAVKASEMLRKLRLKLPATPEPKDGATRERSKKQNPHL